MTARSPKDYVFLSHAGVDTQKASELADLLRRSAIEVWFDKDDVEPSAHWMVTLEKAVQNASGMVVYVGRLGIQAWMDREVRLGLVHNTARPEAYPLIPVLGEGADPDTLPPFLQQHQYVDLRYSERLTAEIGRLQELLKRKSEKRAITAEYWSGNSPFRGLQVFEANDAWLFFGRDSDTDQLLERLSSAPTLAILGNSGSGKSSLLRAGLIPAIRRGRLRLGSRFLDTCRIAIVRPSDDPFAELAESVPRQLAPELSAPQLRRIINEWRQHLTSGPSALRDCIAAITGSNPEGTRVLLIVDQFEEIFALTTQHEVREKYINALLGAARIEGSIPVQIVISMRADFYPQCLDHPHLSRLLESSVHNVSVISEEQMRDNIEKRLFLAGSKAEAGLIDSLLNDAATEPGNLALLEHALGELWRKQGGYGCILTNGAYAEIGGLRGSLARHADATYQGLTASEQLIASKIFMSLVQLGEGAPDTRRRVHKRALLELGPREEIEALLARLASARLITTGGNRQEDQFVEVSHEALIREWPTLREWIRQNREDLRFERRLMDRAEDWDNLNRDPSTLLGGVVLLTAEDWLRKRERVPALVAWFIEAGIQARERQLKREQSKRRNRIWGFSIVTAGIVVLSLSAALWTRSQKNFAEARALHAWAAVSLNEDPERTLTLGLYAWNKQHAMVPGLEELLHTALLQPLSRLTLVGHQDPVWSIAWSPDGTRLATASEDKTVQLWEATQGRKLQTLTGHQAGILSIVWSPDGSKLATASEDKTAKVWDVSSGRALLTLSGHSAEVFSISWSPDGTKIATGSVDKTTKIWDVASGRELRTLAGHTGTIYSVAWSPDGNMLATASEDKTAKLWNPILGQELRTLVGHQAFVMSIAWSSDGMKLVTGGQDKTARVWDEATGRELLVLRGHLGEVASVAWSSDGHQIATASYDKTIKLWNVDTGRELQTFRGHQGAVWTVAWSPDGRSLATASLDNTAKIWDAGPPHELTTLLGHQDEVLSIAWSPDGRKLATGSRDKTAKVWDAATARELRTLDGHHGSVWNIAWSPDGKKLATASLDKTAKLWDTATGRQLQTLTGHTKEIVSIAWSPDGSKVATASYDKTARVWDVESGRSLNVLHGHDANLWAVAWSPDGNKLATASEDHTAKIWDAHDGHELLTLRGHENWVMSVAWSPDGTKLATTGEDKTARVWNPITGRELQTLNGHAGFVVATVWSPDGKKLATASDDQTAKVWDIATGRELITLRGHQSGLYAVAWSPDGKMLASAGGDKIAQIYIINQVDLLNLIHSRITRNLTLEECRRYMNTNQCPPLR